MKAVSRLGIAVLAGFISLSASSHALAAASVQDNVGHSEGMSNQALCADNVSKLREVLNSFSRKAPSARERSSVLMQISLLTSCAAYDLVKERDLTSLMKAAYTFSAIKVRATTSAEAVAVLESKEAGFSSSSSVDSLSAGVVASK